MTQPIVALEDVDVIYRSRTGGLFRREHVHALTGVTASVGRGEVLGVVGESGCGKSTLAKVLMGLQPPTHGMVRFRGEDLAGMAPARRRSEFGSSLGVVFQDPATALNPRMSVRRILRDPLDVHRRGSDREREARVDELLALVGLPDSAGGAVPAQLSGGQRQRVAIARALALDPDVVIADEPTSALDVSVRAQVLNLLCDLRSRLGLGLVFVSHDIQTVRYIADRVAVMYLGRVVEHGVTRQITDAPRHPYTRALFSATPSLLDRADRIVLHGPVPSATRPPSGCPFRTRCWKATDECATAFPAVAGDTDHSWHCLHPEIPARSAV